MKWEAFKIELNYINIHRILKNTNRNRIFQRQRPCACKTGRHKPSPEFEVVFVPGYFLLDFDRDGVFGVELGIRFPRLHVGEFDLRLALLQRAPPGVCPPVFSKKFSCTSHM